jgi:hypothetical protein
MDPLELIEQARRKIDAAELSGNALDFQDARLLLAAAAEAVRAERQAVSLFAQVSYVDVEG